MRSQSPWSCNRGQEDSRTVGTGEDSHAVGTGGQILTSSLLYFGLFLWSLVRLDKEQGEKEK